MWIRIVQIVLALSVFVGGGYYATERVEEVAVNIKAATDIPDLGLPVYAQFIVTQKLQLNDIVDARALVVPMYVPVVSQPVVIRMFRNGKRLYEWDLPTDALGVADVYLPLSDVLLDGDIEVQFDGSAILHEDKDLAPRLFVESQDLAYPGGNYRIANNEKEGDISLRITEEVPRWQWWYHRYDSRRLDMVAQIVFILLGFVLLWQLPRILVHTN